MATSAIPIPRLPGLGRTLFRRQPQWWTLAVAGVAWCALLRLSGEHMHHRGLQFVHWACMIAAMMWPLAAARARGVAFRSLWRRRHVAMGEYLAGYTAVWMLAGLALVPLSAWMAPAAAFMMAIAWHLTPMRAFAMSRSHRMVPLAPAGWPAHRDAVVHGAVNAADCCVACWAAMLACASAGHHPLVMAAMLGLAYAERAERRPRPVPYAFGLAAVGAAYWLTRS